MTILKEVKTNVDGSRLSSLSGSELLCLLQQRVTECTDPNPVPANAFRAAVKVVEVLNAWIMCGRGDSHPATMTTRGSFLPDTYGEIR
jgi:hypothetical protein